MCPAVLDRVDEGFLSDAPQIVLGVGRKRARRSLDEKARFHRPAVRRLLDHLGERLGQSIVSGRRRRCRYTRGGRTQGGHRAPCLAKAGAGQAARSLDVRAGDVRLAGENILGGLQLNHNAHEALGQRVVDFAREPVALLKHGGLLFVIGQAGQLHGKHRLLGQRAGKRPLLRPEVARFAAVNAQAAHDGVTREQGHQQQTADFVGCQPGVAPDALIQGHVFHHERLARPHQVAP